MSETKHTLGERVGQCWLWPDRRIGKRESRILREEHNALVNVNADLLAALEMIAGSEPRPTRHGRDLYRGDAHRALQRLARAAIRKARGE